MNLIRHFTNRPAYFLLAKPDARKAGPGSSISENDVFLTEVEALDALDVHYGWAKSLHDRELVAATDWYLQEARLGRFVQPAQGSHFLTALLPYGDRKTVAGGFSSFGETVDWMTFVFAAIETVYDRREWFDLTSDDIHPDLVDPAQIWFRPISSRQVYPMDLV